MIVFSKEVQVMHLFQPMRCLDRFCLSQAQAIRYHKDG